MIDVKVPSPGESITEVEIGNWLVNDGDYVEMDQELAEINSDKATLTINAENDGVIKIKEIAGTQVKVGQIIAQIDISAKAPVKKENKKEVVMADKGVPEKVLTKAELKTYAQGVPSVSAAKLMEEKGLTSGISGSGRGGRITKSDVIEQLSAEPNKNTENNGNKQNGKANHAPVMAGLREQRKEKMSLLRRKISARLVSVKNETAMLTTFNEVDMLAIMEMRKKYKDKFKEVHGVGLGFMSFFTKACTEALKYFPAVNAQIQGEEILYFNYVDMGIAVSSDRGLVVPIIRNAESMNLAQIESSIGDYGARAKEGKITVDEMTGGTFTITNGGVFGSMLSTPILNPPQSAILGMHNIIERPVALNGQVVIRPIMYLALSYDHRIVDGKEAVSFLVKVKELLEDPSRMLLGL